MRRALLNKLPIRYLHITHHPHQSLKPNPKIITTPFHSFQSKFRFFSTENENDNNSSTFKSETTTISPPPAKDLDVKDVSNKGTLLLNS